MVKTFPSEIQAVFTRPDPSRAPRRNPCAIRAFDKVEPLPIRYFDESQLSHSGKYDSKDLRMFNRATLLALEGLYDLDFNRACRDYDRNRIGLYVVGSWGRFCAEVINEIDQGRLSIFQAMRAHFPPKFNLRNMLALLPGHLSIHFDVRGPTNSFLSREGISQAYQKARLDFADNAIDLAALVVINSYEEETLSMTHWGSPDDQRIMNEAAGVILLHFNDVVEFRMPPDDANCFGYLEKVRHYWECHDGK